MELFSEVYGCYYAVVAEVLRQAPLNRRQVEALVGAQGYGESTLELLPRLLTDRTWPFLIQQGELYQSRLKHPPVLPLTTLERAWLKALLADPRIRLFLTEEQLAILESSLADVDPLYEQEDFVYFDRYLDGDNYADLGYRERFQAILLAMREGRFLHLDYGPAKRREQQGCYRPLRLEYSAKDDKFRIYAVKAWHGVFQGYHTLNLGRIVQLSPAMEHLDHMPDVNAFRQRHRCEEPLIIQIFPERNAPERFLVEFSSYEKQSEYDAEKDVCTVKLWYQKDDESEVLIRLLGFGPVLKVVAPKRFVDLIRGRIRKQMALLKRDPARPIR